MGTKTTISWTDATWNPIRGCSRVSEGCRNCYAEMVARRFSGPGLAYEGLVRIDSTGHPQQWNGEIKFVEKHLLDPLKWKEPRRIFVNSMSDLFHENVTDEMRDKIFAVMALCPQHTFQVLTKRPVRMREYLAEPNIDSAVQAQITELCLGVLSDRLHARAVGSTPNGWGDFPLKHVQLGVSCENQATADERIPLLLDTPAAVRFLSCEPLLGPIRLDECAPYTIMGDDSNPGVMNAFNAQCYHPLTARFAPERAGNSDGISWVIVGGESGCGARACDVAWIRSIVEQCKAAGTACFVKQMGSNSISSRDADGVFIPDYEYHLLDKKGADISEFPACIQVREFPCAI